MTIAQLASTIASKEGKKHQATIGDIREVLGILSDIIVQENRPEILELLIVHGKKREKRNKPKKPRK